MIQILYNYLYPDTLAKLYDITKDDYCIFLCGKRLGFKIFTIKNSLIDEHININGIKMTMLKENNSIELFNKNIKIKINIDEFQNLHIFYIITQLGIDINSIINKIPSFFLEFYNDKSLSIDFTDDCFLICNELQLNLQIGNDIKNIKYKSKDNKLINLI